MIEPPIVSQIAGATLWLASLALIMLISSIKEEIERRRIEKRNRELEAQIESCSCEKPSTSRTDCKTASRVCLLQAQEEF